MREGNSDLVYNSPEVQRMWKLASRYMTVGMEIALCVGIGFGGGGWLDKKFSTEPWLLVLFGIGGLGAASRVVWRIVKSTRLSQLDQGG